MPCLYLYIGVFQSHFPSSNPLQPEIATHSVPHLFKEQDLCHAQAGHDQSTVVDPHHPVFFNADSYFSLSSCYSLFSQARRK